MCVCLCVCVCLSTAKLLGRSGRNFGYRVILDSSCTLFYFESSAFSVTSKLPFCMFTNYRSSVRPFALVDF